MALFTKGELAVELNMADYEVRAEFERLIKKANEEAKAARDSKGSASERMKGQCEAVANLYDSMFGEGATQKAFGGNLTDLVKAIEGMQDVVEWMFAADAADAERLRVISQKYAPNRAARRAAKK